MCLLPTPVTLVQILISSHLFFFKAHRLASLFETIPPGCCQWSRMQWSKSFKIKRGPSDLHKSSVSSFHTLALPYLLKEPRLHISKSMQMKFSFNVMSYSICLANFHFSFKIQFKEVQFKHHLTPEAFSNISGLRPPYAMYFRISFISYIYLTLQKLVSSLMARTFHVL